MTRGRSAARLHHVAAGRLRSILAAVKTLGLDPAELLAAAGVPSDVVQSGGNEGDVSLAQYLQVWEAAVRKSGRADLPMRAATALAPDSFGVVGFSCILSPTVGEAFARLSRMYTLLVTGARWSLEPEGQRLCIAFDLDAPPSLGRRCAIEFALAEQVHFTRMMAAGNVEVLEATFPHEPPADATSYRELFRCPLLWNRERATLVVDRSVFELKHSKADPHLLAYFDRQAERLLAQRSNDKDTSARVRRLLVDALADGPPSADLVAKRLGVSPRSLRRRLADEGTSFHTLVEDTRNALAQQYLTDPKLTVSEIAFLVGFSALSPFQRAFRRWTKLTPREYRHRLA
jgi:AraC-like DNA-binding protein